MKNKEFPNGLTSYLETYYEVVSMIEEFNGYDYSSERVTMIYESQGRGGLYELAKSLADKFETIHKGRVWDGEFFDTIDKFLEEELYEKS
ncbi:MAG: hypothetical protein ACRCXT_04440 [Paraclostridium sp.]